MEDIMTVKELASYLKMKESTVQKFAKRGNLPAIKLGKQWRFKKDKILELFQETRIQEYGRRSPGLED